ncbi:hypothetical protein ACEQ8H_005615 [Pleosporales sp. CAS-2024a]
MPDMETAELKQQVLRLQQECRLWKDKSRDAKAEALAVATQSSRRTRHVKALEDQCALLQSQLTAQREDQLTATKRSLHRIKSSTAASTPPTQPGAESKELESMRLQLKSLEQENAKLKKLHENSNCEEILRKTADELAEARKMQKAAEHDIEGFTHLLQANELIETQILAGQEQLRDTLCDLQKRENEVESLQLHIEVHRAELLAAQDRVAALQAELLQSKPQQLDADSSLRATKSSERANIVINVEPTQKKHWNFLKRAQSSFTGASNLDISGPPALVAPLVAAMRDADADYKEKSAAAAHWEKVANDALAELDNMRAMVPDGPICTVASHRSVKDELDAKDLQLHMQAQLVAKWQHQIEAVKTAICDATLELREGGVRGV